MDRQRGRGRSPGDDRGRAADQVRQPRPAAPGSAQGGVVAGSLADVLRTWVQEGRNVRMAVGDTVWLARPDGVSAELVQVGPTFVVLAAVTSVRAGLAGVQAGDPVVDPPRTLLGLLEQLAGRAELVELGGPDLEPVQGRVLIVSAGSHIVVAADDGSEWLLPLEALGWVSLGAGDAG